MTSQPALFYAGDFDQLLSEFEETREPSMQEIHNMAIVKFLKNGDSILPSLKPLLEQMRSDSGGEGWPTHMSWNLFNYHIGLYHFYAGNLDECRAILKNIWNNEGTLDQLVMVCVSLLTCEFAVRTGETENVAAAKGFLEGFARQESAETVLASKVNNKEWVERVMEHVRFVCLRLEVSQAMRMPAEQAKPILERVLAATKISSDPKNRCLLPVAQVIPLAQAALYLKDREKYVEILECANEPTHAAILNNRGIFELMNERYASALLHFSKALEARKGTAIVHPFQQVIYNIGISLLMRQKPREAFQFLHIVVPLMPKSPCLWLRLAECCVMFYRQRVAQLRKETQKSPVIAQQFSTTTKTFIVLPQSDYELFERYPIQGEGFVRDLNLNFAQKCTRNAISLCGEDGRLKPVKVSAELLCSFISLELGDGRRAIDMGRSVFTATDVDNDRQFYAKIYAVQGYAMIGDANEAQKIVSRMLIESSRDLKDNESWLLLHQLTFVKVFLTTNDTSKAQGHFAKISEVHATRPEVVLMRVAIELKNRNMQQALAAIHACADAE